NPYGLLGFDGEPQRALRADDDHGVVYLGSFSKTIAAGLRVGWALAPAGIRDKLVLAAEAAVLCSSSLAQLIVGEYLASQPWREQVKVFRELYRERRDAMLGALGAVMPGACRGPRPGGGFYVWLQLPPGLNSKSMLPRAISSRVAYVPGTGFYADGGGAEYLRLSYCFPEPARIREGIRRLADVGAAETELRATFGAARAGLPGGAGPAAPTGPPRRGRVSWQGTPGEGPYMPGERRNRSPWALCGPWGVPSPPGGGPPRAGAPASGTPSARQGWTRTPPMPMPA